MGNMANALVGTIILVTLLSEGSHVGCMDIDDDGFPVIENLEATLPTLYTFKNKMVKEVLQTGLKLRSGVAVSPFQLTMTKAMAFGWLGIAYGDVMKKLAETSHAEDIQLSEIKAIFCQKLEIKLPLIGIWDEIIGSTALFLYDGNEDGQITLAEANNNQERFMKIGGSLISKDAGHNGIPIDSLEDFFSELSQIPEFQRAAKLYAGVIEHKEELHEAVNELLNKFEVHTKKTDSQIKSKYGWKPSDLWKSSTGQVILTGIIAIVIIAVVWDVKSKGRGTGKGVGREALRLKRQQYLDSVRSPGPKGNVTSSPSREQVSTGNQEGLDASGSPDVSGASLDKGSHYKGQVKIKNDSGLEVLTKLKNSGLSPREDGPYSTKQMKDNTQSLEAEVNRQITPEIKSDSQDGVESVKQEPKLPPRQEPNPPQKSPKEKSVSTLSLVGPSKWNNQMKNDRPNTMPMVQSDEDILLEHLSAILDSQVVNIDIQKAPSRALQITSIDQKSILKAASLGSLELLRSTKLASLFESRANQAYGNLIPFSCRCWNRCRHRLDSHAGKGGMFAPILEHLQRLCTNQLITCLNEVIVSEDFGLEDSLWSNFKPDPSRSTESKQLLESFANWDEDGMSADLLRDILTATSTTPQGHHAWVKVIRSAGQVIKVDQRWDEHSYKYEKMLIGLEALFKMPEARFILLRRLKEEVEASKSSMGGYFEKESVLGPLLSLSMVPKSLVEGANLKSATATLWTQLRSFPQLTEDDVRPLKTLLAKSRQFVNQALMTGLKDVVRADQSLVMMWLSRLLALNELRTVVTPRIQPSDVHPDLALSDGFMLNMCHILLNLCSPFCEKADKMSKIDSFYPASESCCLGYSQEPSLAGGIILGSETEEQNMGPLEQEEPKDLSSEKSYNFMTHIFHITLRALNIGFIPALQQFKKQMKAMNDSMDVAEEKGLKDQAKAQQIVVIMQWESQLTNYDLLVNGTRFYLTVCMWISQLLEQAKQSDDSKHDIERRQQLALQNIPEFVIKDMAHWFTFMANHGVVVHRGILDYVKLDWFIETCVMFLTRPDLLPGPIPASALCETLLTFVSGSRAQPKHRESLWRGDVMSNLEVAVHSNPYTQNDLCPGLIRTYVSVDVVEGLDVDKDDFDKYSSRSVIGRLITNLWSRMDCRQSILQMCGTSIFQSFLGAIFDTLLYQLHDSLSRLSNVRKLEQSKESWESLPLSEQQQKAQTLRGEEKVAKGFMTMATETISLLELITAADDVAYCLTVMPLAKRVASAFLGFLESLCGSRSADFKVKDMKKYNWEPRVLLLQLTGMVVKIEKQEKEGETNFTTSMVTDPDFNTNTMTRALQVLEEKTVAQDDLVVEFTALVETLCEAHDLYVTSGGAIGNENKFVNLNKVVDEEQLSQTYKTELGPLCYNNAPLIETHAFQKNASSMTVDARSKRSKALMKEMRTWMSDLPVDAKAAIFIRQDEERMDVVRALVTGPEDTPYSLGCFVFDIYFPPTYPDIPPLVKFTTTGGGTVRFNPNLYADGKVCLSLLGTWHGGDATQKWQAGKSSLYQVLLSIQSMILINEPMYNEPGYEGLQDTEEGDAQSNRYNGKIRLFTLRHAILSHILRPPAGFENVIRRHYFHQKDMVKKQCYEWLNAVEKEPELRQKMEAVVSELCVELDRIIIENKDDESLEELSEEDETR